MVILWVFVYQIEKKTIVVISAHARFISTMPMLLLVWVFACYGPSAFYLEDIRVGYGKKRTRQQAGNRRCKSWGQVYDTRDI
jgi:outer membrane phospholipase A